MLSISVWQVCKLKLFVWTSGAKQLNLAETTHNLHALNPLTAVISRDHAVVTQSFSFSFLLVGNVITIKRKKPSDTSYAKQLQYGAWEKHFVRKITDLETNFACADVHGYILFKKEPSRWFLCPGKFLLPAGVASFLRV